MKHEEHQHSGANGNALVVLPLGGVLGATLLSFIYAYISVYSPIAGYISFLFVLGFAFLVGFLMGQLAKASKCRNTKVLTLLGLGVSCWALYASWVIFLYALFSRYSDDSFSLIGMFLSPGAVWSSMVELGKTGWYSLKGNTISGGLLWFFWGVEAVTILGVGTILSREGITEEVYCERCNQWCNDGPAFSLAAPEQGTEMLAEAHISQLANLPAVDEEAPGTTVQVESKHCDSCTNTSAFWLKKVVTSLDKDGKKSTNKDDLTKVLLLNKTEYDQLKQLAERPAPA